MMSGSGAGASIVHTICRLWRRRHERVVLAAKREAVRFS